MNHVSDWMSVDLGIVAPDGREGMMQHARGAVAAWHPVHIRSWPGPAHVQRPELLKFVSQATYLAVNDYEGKMLEERTGKPIEALAEMVDAVIVTRGASGSTIYTGVNGSTSPA